MLFFPVVRIGKNDWCRLMQLAFDPQNNAHPAAVLLRSEVHRSIVTDELDLKEIVHLNGPVAYQMDGREPLERLLVHPDDYRPGELNLSVLTCVGAALIGIRVGDAMPFVCSKGHLHMVTVLPPRRISNASPIDLPRLSEHRRQRADLEAR
jgi:transcription elongation GreA/GreB family factor